MSLTRKTFKRLHYPVDVIALCVCWYLAYALSLRNFEEMMTERGMDATIHQHVSVGEGKVDFGSLFRTLREMDFANRTFKVGGESIIGSSLFGYPRDPTVLKTMLGIRARGFVSYRRINSPCPSLDGQGLSGYFRVSG